MTSHLRPSGVGHPLRVLCACDTFKGTLAPDRVGDAVEAGYRLVWQQQQQQQHRQQQHPKGDASLHALAERLAQSPALPAVTIPPLADTHRQKKSSRAPAGGDPLSHIAAGLLAYTLASEATAPSPENTEPSAPRLSSGSNAASSTTASTTGKEEQRGTDDHVRGGTEATEGTIFPVVFTNMPMSDGGAGLLDSVTYPTSKAHTAETTPATATTPTASAKEKPHIDAAQTASPATDEDTRHAPPNPNAPTAPDTTTTSRSNNTSSFVASSSQHHQRRPSPTLAQPNPAHDTLHVERVYVPASVPITGPLSTPLCHEVSTAHAANRGGRAPTQARKNRCTAASTDGVSFACDVSRGVVVIEMAEAAGLPRIVRPQDRHPGGTTTFGVGELIKYALRYVASKRAEQTCRTDEVKDGAPASDAANEESSASSSQHPSLKDTQQQQQQQAPPHNGIRLFLGIGGSATNDGGLGALQALGLDIFVKAEHGDDAGVDCGEDARGKRRAGAISKGKREERTTRAAAAGSEPSSCTPHAEAMQKDVDTARDEEEEERREDEVLLNRPFCGADLARVTRVSISEQLKRLFPYLCPTSSRSAVNGGAVDHGQTQHEPSLYISEVCLICDVDNTLVGARGATYTFGPQKCAPPEKDTNVSKEGSGDDDDASSNHRTKEKALGADQRNGGGDAVGEDAAVGAITSYVQRHLLDSLEAGMRHAATRVVASTWRDLAGSDASSELQQNDCYTAEAQTTHPSEATTAASSAASQASKSNEVDGGAVRRTPQEVEAHARGELLYRPGGGGAGGMSGFFRYLLKACYVPGADVVAGLLGLYETPRVAQLLGRHEEEEDVTEEKTASSVVRVLTPSDDTAAVHQRPPKHPCVRFLHHPRGRLFHDCDVVVSGEGSFDDQTISSHKTVGRLLEMCTAANAYRLWHHYCSVPPRHNRHRHNHSDISSSPPPSFDERRRGKDVESAEQQHERPEQQQQQKQRHHHHGPCHCRCIEEFLVVCGRSGFDDYAACQSAVLDAVCATLLGTSEKRDGKGAASGNGGEAANLPESSPSPPSASSSTEGEPASNASAQTNQRNTNDTVNGDVERLRVYVRDLVASTAFRKVCDAGHHMKREPQSFTREAREEDAQDELVASSIAQSVETATSTSGSAPWDAAYVVRHYCVPRVTLLPLTPELFAAADAMHRPFACVEAAVAHLLKDSVARLSRVVSA